MARPIRLQLAGAHYFVIARAASPGELFTSERERARFVELLARSCTRYRWRVQAWCLGVADYRLLLWTERANLAAGVRHLNSVHSQTLHRDRRVGGALFEGRYISSVVDPTRALFAAAADVLLAPVRAGLVADVADWAWSSYHATIGASPAPEWLVVRDLLQPYATDPAGAAAAFISALRALPTEAEDSLATFDAYADAEYIARMIASNVPDAERAPELQRVRRPLRELAGAYTDRAEAMRAAYRAGYSQKEIARYFDVHTATVSRAVAAGREWPRITSPVIAALRHVHD